MDKLAAREIAALIAEMPTNPPNFRSGDAVFFHSAGAFNVSKAERLVSENPVAFGPLEVDIEPEMLAQVERLVLIDPVRRDALTDEQLEKPGLAVMLDGFVLPIEGHHRFTRRGRLGYATMKFYLIPPQLVGEITMYRTAVDPRTLNVQKTESGRDYVVSEPPKDAS
jgi:hypothetical protein